MTIESSITIIRNALGGQVAEAVERVHEIICGPVTADDIAALRAEAVECCDIGMRNLCDQALDNNLEACAEVRNSIFDNRANKHGVCDKEVEKGIGWLVELAQSIAAENDDDGAEIDLTEDLEDARRDSAKEANRFWLRISTKAADEESIEVENMAHTVYMACRQKF